MINTHWLKLPLSRTHFQGSEGVRPIEVLLYTGTANFQNFNYVKIGVYTSNKHNISVALDPHTMLSDLKFAINRELTI